MILKHEHSAGGIVYHLKNGVPLWLITQHSSHKGWGFPKGLIGDTIRNEPIEEAALREVREEGGIRARIIVPNPVETKYTYRFGDYLIKKDVRYFLMEYIDGDPADHDAEVAAARFAAEEDVMATLTYADDKRAFERMLSIYRTISR